MQINQRDTHDIYKFSYQVLISAEFLENKVDEYIQKNAKKFSVSGFRPGKAPRAKILKAYNVSQDVIQKVLYDVIKKTTQDRDIVGGPNFNGTLFSYDPTDLTQDVYTVDVDYLIYPPVDSDDVLKTIPMYEIDFSFTKEEQDALWVKYLYENQLLCIEKPEDFVADTDCVVEIECAAYDSEEDFTNNIISKSLENPVHKNGRFVMKLNPTTNIAHRFFAFSFHDISEYKEITDLYDTMIGMKVGESKKIKLTSKDRGKDNSIEVTTSLLNIVIKKIYTLDTKDVTTKEFLDEQEVADENELRSIVMEAYYKKANEYIEAACSEDFLEKVRKFVYIENSEVIKKLEFDLVDDAKIPMFFRDLLRRQDILPERNVRAELKQLISSMGLPPSLLDNEELFVKFYTNLIEPACVDYIMDNTHKQTETIVGLDNLYDFVEKNLLTFSEV